MTGALENLVQIGQLKKESPSASEIQGLVSSAEARLRDGKKEDLALESRFDLVYNAAHALSLAALRSHGYRAENRYVVFQSTVHTVELEPPEMRVLSDAHRKRNLSEYEGMLDVSEELLSALIRVTRQLLERVRSMPPDSTHGAST